MKIYCLTCKKHVLDTNEEFICGGPYNGSMFKSSPKMPIYSKYPRHKNITKANLQCPWCGGNFISVSGDLLTEHGKIKTGQTTYDPDFNIVWQEGPAKGQLMYIKDSIVPDEKAIETQKQPENVATLDDNGKLIETVDSDLEEEFKEVDEKEQEIKDPRKQRTYELKDSGMSNVKIANEIGVSAVTIGKWLKDR